jgi:thioredoxin-dependent peroxiredoxin
MKNKILSLLAMVVFACSFALNAAEPPKVGDKAPDFALNTLDGQTVHLSNLTAKGKVVLIVLRGWPGYQCPICERQVEDYIASASKLDEAKARVIMVYPGPADALKAHAKEFLEMKGKLWAKDFIFVIDPDYSMVNAYRLRWDVPRETAYPSTFVLDGKGVVRFEKISHTHGDRSRASDILKELGQI